MKKIILSVFILFCGAVLLTACGNKSDIYQAELGCCTWFEETQGNILEYTFTPGNMIVDMNGNKMDYTIAAINDSGRFFVLKAGKSGKYVPVFWKVVDADNVNISRMLKEKKYDSLNAAMSGERTAPWWPLKKKK